MNDIIVFVDMKCGLWNLSVNYVVVVPLNLICFSLQRTSLMHRIFHLTVESMAFETFNGASLAVWWGDSMAFPVLYVESETVSLLDRQCVQRLLKHPWSEVIIVECLCAVLGTYVTVDVGRPKRVQKCLVRFVLKLDAFKSAFAVKRRSIFLAGIPFKIENSFREDISSIKCVRHV